MNISDILAIIGIALTIGFGIAGIVVSIYCWKHNYEEQKKHNELIQKLNALSFNEIHFFTDLHDIIVDADINSIDIGKYFNQDNNTYDGKISKNQIISAIYNMYHNIK